MKTSESESNEKPGSKPKSEFHWPSSRKAAISLTYDDGDDSNLLMAIPDLNKYGLKGTFYLSPGVYPAEQRSGQRWKLAFENGHEIGNHTWSHPCGTALRSERFSSILAFAEDQTGKAEQWLNDHVGFDDERTFAYTCGETHLGPGTDSEAEQRYRQLCEQAFLAARVAGGEPMNPNYAIQSRFTLTACACTFGVDSMDEALKYCERALTTGYWAILIFHYFTEGIPQKSTETRRSIHNSILKWLTDHESELWVAPLRTVYRYIRDQHT